MMSYQDRKRPSTKIGLTLLGAGCIAATAALSVASGTHQTKSSTTTNKTTQSATGDTGFQPTEFSHVEVRSLPSKSSAKTAQSTVTRHGNAWKYAEPGSEHVILPQVTARDVKPMKSENLPGGGTIIHLNGNLMYSSKASVDKNGTVHYDCDQNAAAAHQH